MLDYPAIEPVKAHLVRPILDRVSRFLLHSGLLQNIKTPEGHEFSLSKTMHRGDILSLLRGTYESHEIKMLREHFKETDCIVDLGSNIGVVSRIALEEKLSTNGKIICVEPNPNSFEPLQINMTRGLEGKFNKMVLFERAAIGYTANGQNRAEFLARNNLSSGLAQHLNRNQPDTPIEVTVKSLSEILEKVNGRYSLIADIEGAEIDLIQNEPDALKNCDQIMIELHEPSLTGRKETPEVVLEQIKALGFTLQGQSGNSFCLSR